MSAPRILLMPLGNVLGHLARTFSLAEKLFEKNMDVHITTGMHYPGLIKALPEGITTHHTIEMPVSATRSQGPIRSYGSGTKHDQLNIADDNPDKAMLENSSRHFRKMIADDDELITRLQPDLIVTDYRFTVTHLPGVPAHKVFHISNMLGFPSLYTRSRGALFAPLNKGNVLVPGIRSIEQPSSGTGMETKHMSWCGPFKWNGWKRICADAPPLPESDVLLSFGSTGNAGVLVPWLIDNISGDYRLLLATDDAQSIKQENLVTARLAGLEQCLGKSKVVCCHGGHGTVMECILHKKPMLIIPNNLEQLEIGRRIAELGLGILVDVPPEQMGRQVLNDHIHRLMTDSDIRKNLDHYASLLKQHTGTEQAASIIMSALPA